MRSLAVRVLGDFGVDGVEPQAFGSRKARLVLHLLAVTGGQAVPTGVLIDALWDAAPPARPEDQLAVLVSRLRSVLGRDRIEHRDRGYLLRCDWLDATELAQQAAGTELPASLVESVSARCDELSPPGLLLRTAAVIGPELDADLLAALLGRPVVALLDDAEQAVAKQFLAEDDGIFRFRHELVREALAASATAGRAAGNHADGLLWEADRRLGRRQAADG